MRELILIESKDGKDKRRIFENEFESYALLGYKEVEQELSQPTVSKPKKSVLAELDKF